MTLRNWANRRRCAVCHHCSEMSANYQAAPALPRQRSHSLTVWNQTCPPPNSRNLTQRCRRSEEHTSELQSLMRISYAVFCLKKKNLDTKPQSVIRPPRHKNHTINNPTSLPHLIH